MCCATMNDLPKAPGDLFSRAAIAIALFWAVQGGVRASPFELSPDMEVIAPTPHATLLEDVNLMEAEVVNGSHDAMFQPSHAKRTSLGVTSAPWWIRFQAKNPTVKPIDWVMNFPFPMVDVLDIAVVDGDGEIVRYELGDKRPLSANPLPGEGYAVPITTAPGQTSTIYVRMQNLLGDGLDSYFEVSSPRAYADHQQKVLIFLGIILGGGIVLFLYNAVVYLVVRESLYVWYLLYLLCALIAYLAASGLGHQLLWARPESIVNEAIPPVFSALTFIFVIQFSRKFLETKKHWPKMDLGLRAGLVYFLLPPAAFFLGHSSLAAFLIMAGSIALAALPLLGFYAWIQGQKTALIFTLAWGFWFAAMCSMSSRFLGLLPTNDFTLRVGWVGILGEAVLFALAMAVRIRSLRQEKTAAEAREHAALQRSKAELEVLVRERTQELATQHEQLRRLNSEKDKLFSIIAHDLRNPIQGIVGLSDVLVSDIHQMSREEIDTCLRDLQQSANAFHKSLENLLSWALLQLGGVKFRPEAIELSPLVDHCVALFKQSADEKNVSLETSGVDSLQVKADPQMLATIVRNLLSNAIKYSKPGGRVLLSAERKTATVEIAVSDQGVGMDEKKIANLFHLGERISTPGTEGEPGTGLGLQLCRELVEKHGSILSVESARDAGTTFRFSLPLS